MHLFFTPTLNKETNFLLLKSALRHRSRSVSTVYSVVSKYQDFSLRDKEEIEYINIFDGGSIGDPRTLYSCFHEVNFISTTNKARINFQARPPGNPIVNTGLILEYNPLSKLIQCSILSLTQSVGSLWRGQKNKKQHLSL